MRLSLPTIVDQSGALRQKHSTDWFVNRGLKDHLDDFERTVKALMKSKGTELRKQARQTILAEYRDEMLEVL